MYLKLLQFILILTKLQKMSFKKQVSKRPSFCFCMQAFNFSARSIYSSTLDFSLLLTLLSVDSADKWQELYHCTKSTTHNNGCSYFHIQ